MTSIGIEMASARWMRGMGRYVRSLVPALLMRDDPWGYTLITPMPLADLVPESPRACEYLVAPRPRSVWLSGDVVSAAKRASLSLIHFPANDFWLRRPRGVRVITTIHDLAVETFPEVFLPRRLDRIVWSLKRRRARAMVDRIICDSTFVRNDIVERWSWPEERIEVVCPGVSRFFSPGEGPAGRPYLLYVGALDFRKNLPRLLEAFSIVAPRTPDLELVLAGGRGPNPRIYPPLKIPAAVRGRVRIEDAPDDVRLRDLYRGAVGLVMPSIYEGFGLPVLEAMASGCPVLCSTAASLPEVAGDAAVMFEPGDPGEIAEAMHRISEDSALRATLRADGLRRAGEFTWEKTAAQTTRIYRDTLPC